MKVKVKVRKDNRILKVLAYNLSGIDFLMGW